MENLKKMIENLHIECTEKMLQQFAVYMEGVLEWNEKINLTAITDRDEFIVKHYVDSLIAKDIEAMKYAETVIDVGTGGGFPGVPLVIIFPEKQFVLMDSLNKRIKFLFFFFSLVLCYDLFGKLCRNFFISFEMHYEASSRLCH